MAESNDLKSLGLSKSLIDKLKEMGVESFAEKTAERIERLARLHNIKAIAEPFLYEGDVEAIRVLIFEGKRAAEDFTRFLQEEVDIYEILEIGYIDNILWRFLFKILPNSLIRKIFTQF